MKRRLAMAAAAAALVALPAAWYFGSPWWTLWRMREAARSGDSARLASYVDHRAIAAQWMAEGRLSWSGVLDMLRPGSPRNREFLALAKRRLAQRPPSDADVKEEIRPWLTEFPIRFPGFGGGGGDPQYRPFIVHRGLGAFEVRDRRSSAEFGPVLTFRRHGLAWKLEAVRFGQQ